MLKERSDSMGFLKSIKTLFGSVVHYNERGEKVGESLDGFFPEQKIHYDNDGNYLGRTDPGLLRKTSITKDQNNNVVITSSENLDGSYRHLDNDHRVIGTTIFTPIQVKTQLEIDHIFIPDLHEDSLDGADSECYDYDCGDNDYSNIISDYSYFCNKSDDDLCLNEDDDNDCDSYRKNENDEDDIDYNDYVVLDCCCVDESEPTCDYDKYDDCTDFDDF